MSALKELLREAEPFLTLEDAAVRLTDITGEKVSAAGLLRLGILGKLTLTIRLLGVVNACKVTIEPSESEDFSDCLVYEPPFLGGLRGDFDLWVNQSGLNQPGLTSYVVNSRGEIENEFGGILVWAPKANRVIEILNANGFGSKTLPSGCSVLISKAVFDSLVSEEVATSPGSAGAHCEPPYEPKRHISMLQRQKDAILEALLSAGHNPRELPKRKDGSKGFRGEVWDKLKSKTRVFQSRRTFDKAWQELRGEGEIKEAKE